MKINYTVNKNYSNINIFIRVYFMSSKTPSNVKFIQNNSHFIIDIILKEIIVDMVN